MNSQYIVLSELLSDQAAFITSPKTSLANYWGGIAPLPPSVYGPDYGYGSYAAVRNLLSFSLIKNCKGRKKKKQRRG